MSAHVHELRTSDEACCPYCRSEIVERFTTRDVRRPETDGRERVLSGWYCLEDECLRPFIVRASA